MPDKTRVYLINCCFINICADGKQLRDFRGITRTNRQNYLCFIYLFIYFSGRQLMIYLALYLIKNYGKDERVTKLVNTTDIFLMPSMNPDGYENSQASFN